VLWLIKKVGGGRGEKSYSKGKKSLSLEEFGMMEINIAGYIERYGTELSQIRK